jgi:hypothetical protein
MVTLRNKVNEIISDMSGRIRNPMILSFILVWLYFHWQLVYLLFTMDTALPMSNRLVSLRTYIADHNNWYGMIGKPLIWSFISLAAYYLIAIVGQAIRIFVGKRLNAHMLSKVDRGAFALKIDLEELRKRNDSLIKELNEVNDSLARYVSDNSKLKTKNDGLSIDLSRITNEYETAKSNILNNPKFIEHFSNTLVVLLGRANKVDGITNRKGEVLKSHFSVINGNWKGLYGGFLPQNSGTVFDVIVHNEMATDFQGNELGSIEDFSFDRGLSLINFKLKRTKETPPRYEAFYLILIHSDEMIGLYNDNFISFKREQ